MSFFHDKKRQETLCKVSCLLRLCLSLVSLSVLKITYGKAGPLAYRLFFKKSGILICVSRFSGRNAP